MMETVNIEYQETNVVKVFGGKRIEVVYVMKHEINHRKNEYRITCELIGLQGADPHFSVYEAEFIGDMEKDSNDETLTKMAAMELFEEHYVN